MSRYLAIDIDAQGLFVVAGSARGGSARVEHALSWADDTFPGLTPDTAKAVGEQLRDRLKEAGIAAAPVLAAVGRDKVILKEVRYPAVAPSEEPALVRFQAMKEMSENADDVVLDYAPILDAAGEVNAERRAMAVVVRKDVFAAVQAMCAFAGLKLAGVTPRPYALAAGLARGFAGRAVSPPDNPADPVALFTTGPQGGEFTVVRGTQVSFTRTVPAPVLANEQTLVNELRRNLTVYGGQNPTQPVRAVYVAEGENALGGWSGRLRTGLPVPVHAFDPLAGAVEAVPAQHRGRFAGAAGLLAGRAANALPINFASPRQPRAAADPKRKQLLLVAAAVGLLVLLGGGYGLLALDRADTELDRLQEKKAGLEKSLAGVDPDLERLKAVDAWGKREVVWLDELYDLADRMPPGDAIRLTGITTTPRPVDKTGKQDAQGLAELKLAAKNPDAATSLTSAFEADNRGKAKFYLNTEKKIGPVAANTAYNQTFTITTKVNHRQPEQYTRFPQFAVPYRKGSGPGAAAEDAEIGDW